MALATYYRNQIYSEEERENLWIEKLDKNIRYIGGEKVKADDEKTIKELQEYYRKINKQLGYGDNKINYDQAKYEEAKRELLILTRLNEKKLEDIKRKAKTTIQEEIKKPRKYNNEPINDDEIPF